MLQQPVDFNLMQDNLSEIEKNTVLSRSIAGNTDFNDEKSEYSLTVEE